MSEAEKIIDWLERELTARMEESDRAKTADPYLEGRERQTRYILMKIKRGVYE